MVIRIRLARFGKCHAPVYNIVVSHARYLSPQNQTAAFNCESEN
jgi:ribosomal protein S16